MMRLTDLFSITSGAAWLPLADAILKATLLFATAGLVSLALRKATAAARHLVWTLALVSAMALPVLSLALPRWQLPVVTLAFSAAVESPALPALASEPVNLIADRQAPDHRRVRVTPSPVSARATQTASAPHEAASLTLLLQNVSWPYALLALWAIGAAAILMRLATGLVGVQWLSRHTERVTDAPWLPLARTLAADLGLSPHIAFLRSGKAAMPMAWGIMRPAVLMPSDADTWPSDRLRIVLLHELAHVKRRDCLTHMLAQLTCALYWFNPLAWVAARHLRTERERACDDLVLAAGTPGPDYADQLLEIARVMRAGRFPAVFAGASLAMAQRSQLEGRLMAILDPTVPRSGVSRFRTVAASSLFACAVMPLAAVQPWGVAAREEPASAASAQAVPAQAAQQAPAPTPLPSVSAPAERAEAPQLPARAATPADAEAASRTGTADHAMADHIGAAAEAAVAGVASNIPSIVSSAMDAAVSAMSHSSADTNVHNGDVQVDVNQDDRKAKSKPADPRMVAALTAALKDVDKDVRETALHALVQLRDPSIFEPLVQALSDAVADVREQAAFGLGQIRDRRAVEPLARALKDLNGDVREQAAFALGQIRDRSAVAALTSVLKDLDDDVREQAVFALGQLRDPAAVDALAMATRDAKPDVRHQAVFALGQIRDRRAVEPLISALKDASPDVREQAAFALGQIRDRGAVEALIIALKDTAPDVRQQAAFALGQIRDPRAIDGLTGALKDSSADVRQQAAFALGQLAR
jgi:HEAT repeat protein/beta-lactamase regulating signal transducer with metallopeptidase domain